MGLLDTKGEIIIKDISINLKRFLDDSSVSSQSLADTKERVRLLGIDLFMFATGDLAMEERIREFEKVDLARAAGIYNYAQAITHRLMTTRGTHPEDRFFGIPWLNYLGRTYTTSTTVLSSLTQEITDELLKDSRTQDVIYVTPNFISPTIIRVDTAVLPIGVTDKHLEIGLSIRNS